MPDPVMDTITELRRENEQLHAELAALKKKKKKKKKDITELK